MSRSAFLSSYQNSCPSFGPAGSRVSTHQGLVTLGHSARRYALMRVPARPARASASAAAEVISAI